MSAADRLASHYANTQENDTWTDSEGDRWTLTQDERTGHWTATGIGHKGKAYAVSLRAMKEGIEAGIAWEVHGIRTSAP